MENKMETSYILKGFMIAGLCATSCVLAESRYKSCHKKLLD